MKNKATLRVAFLTDLHYTGTDDVDKNGAPTIPLVCERNLCRRIRYSFGVPRNYYHQDNFKKKRKM